MSQEIKILAEVEKIWIIYDSDKNGNLEYAELLQYLKDVAVPSLTMSEE